MKRLLSFTAFCLAFAITPYAHGETTDLLIAIPADAVGADQGATENTALGEFSNTVLTGYRADLLAAAGLQANDVITGLSFRVGGGGSREAPNFRVDEYIIELGALAQNVSVGSIGSANSTFAGNFNGQRVHSGAVEFSADDFDDSTATGNGDGGPANNFGTEIVFENSFVYDGGDLGFFYTHTTPEALNGSLVTSGADAVTGFLGTDNGTGTSGTTVRSLFGDGFDADVGDLGTSTGFGVVVQFTVARSAVPEPSSAVLLVSLGMIGVVRRRK